MRTRKAPSLASAAGCRDRSTETAQAPATASTPSGARSRPRPRRLVAASESARAGRSREKRSAESRATSVVVTTATPTHTGSASQLKRNVASAGSSPWETMPACHQRAPRPPSRKPAREAGTEAARAWTATARRTWRGLAPIERTIASSRCCCATAVPMVETTTKIDM